MNDYDMATIIHLCIKDHFDTDCPHKNYRIKQKVFELFENIRADKEGLKGNE